MGNKCFKADPNVELSNPPRRGSINKNERTLSSTQDKNQMLDSNGGV